MRSFDAELHQRLDVLRDRSLLRGLRRVDSPQGIRIRIDGCELLNFSSNDYLGLANHPFLKDAALGAVRDFGVGAGSSRLICGSLSPFHELEEVLASFKESEAALTFSTGYAAALGTIPALVGKEDVIIVDRLAHACLVDAARLSGARLRVFAHNDLNDLEAKLQWATSHTPHSEARRRILIITESIFSMDGDAVPLIELVSLKEKYDAWLMVDEAHATGLYGAYRRGLAEQAGVSDRIEVQMGTLGKALGSSGGYVCGSRTLIDYLVNRARAFIFSTAPPPAAAAAAAAAIGVIQSDAGATLTTALWENVAQFNRTMGRPHSATASAIIPIILGEESIAVSAATQLRDRGYFVPAIRYPSVAKGSARLRITLTAGHTQSEIEHLAEVLLDVIDQTRPHETAPAGKA